MTELLIQSYRDGNETLVNHYYGLLSSFPNMDWLAPDLAIADTTAQIPLPSASRTGRPAGRYRCVSRDHRHTD